MGYFRVCPHSHTRWGIQDLTWQPSCGNYPPCLPTAHSNREVKCASWNHHFRSGVRTELASGHLMQFSCGEWDSCPATCQTAATKLLGIIWPCSLFRISCKGQLPCIQECCHSMETTHNLNLRAAGFLAGDVTMHTSERKQTSLILISCREQLFQLNSIFGSLDISTSQKQFHQACVDKTSTRFCQKCDVFLLCYTPYRLQSKLSGRQHVTTFFILILCDKCTYPDFCVTRLIPNFKKITVTTIYI